MALSSVGRFLSRWKTMRINRCSSPGLERRLLWDAVRVTALYVGDQDLTPHPWGNTSETWITRHARSTGAGG